MKEEYTSMFMRLVIVLWLSLMFGGNFANGESLRDNSLLPTTVDSSNALKQVKTRLISYWLGGAGNGAYRKKALQENDNRVQMMLSKPFIPVVWEDSTKLTINLRLNELAGKLRAMALAYHSKGGRYEKNQVVRQRIIDGIKNILNFYNPSTSKPGNWYGWLISLPDNLGVTALLMGSDLPDDLRDRLIQSLSHVLTDKLILTGSNAVAEGRNHIYLALLENDPNRLKRGAAYIFRTVRYGTQQGVREDYCYLYHGHIPYAGAYGASFAQTIAEFIFLFDGTPWAIENSHRDLVMNLLLDHSRWFLSNGKLDFLVRGRAYGQQSNGASVLKGLLLMSQVKGPGSREAAQSAVAILEDSTRRNLDLSSAGFADRLSGLKGAMPMGFRYWPSGEIAAFNQPAFHIGMRQYSSRVQDYEYLMRADGGEGGEGWNLAFGFTHIMRADGRGSWYDSSSGRMLPEIDMERLPGTTTRIDAHPVNPLFEPDPDKLTMSTTGYSLNYGTSNFAGGAGGKDGGIAGFVLEPKYGDFKVKKSVFFFPQGFWAMGSGIHSDKGSIDSNDKPIQTTILQWVCEKSGPEVIFNNTSFKPGKDTVSKLDSVRWFHIQNEKVSVVFNKPTPIYVRLKNHILTVWLDHGLQPVTSGYAYAVLPDITLDDTRNFVKDMPVRPQRMDEKVHAVVSKADNSCGMVFFEPDSCLGIVASSPLIVYRRMEQGGGLLTMQDPLHSKKKFHFDVRGLKAPFRKMDSAIRVIPLAAGKHKVEIATALGRIYRLGYGTLASEATKVPRKNLDLSDYQDFQVEAKSNPKETILTVHLPEEAIGEGYRLSVHFIKSQRRYDFSEKDIIDRPTPNTVRYRWLRKPSKGPSVFSKYLKTNHGRFTVNLVTPWIEATDSFIVPNFNKQ